MSVELRFGGFGHRVLLFAAGFFIGVDTVWGLIAPFDEREHEQSLPLGKLIDWTEFHGVVSYSSGPRAEPGFALEFSCIRLKLRSTDATNL